MIDNKSEIVVSVVMTAYNHEKYIKQAVDSVLSQKTNFNYELIIGDDASKDSTQEILKQYSALKNVHLFLRKKNSKGKNWDSLINRACGKYIFGCDGDDYWIGEDVLQEFVDFLEKNPQYIGVSGRRVVLSEKTGKKSVNIKTARCHQTVDLNGFLNGEKYDFCATMFRNILNDGKYDYRTHKYSRWIGDLTMCILILLHGPVYVTDKIIGVYRTDRIKNTSSYNATRNMNQIYEEHIDLVHKLESKIPDQLDFSYLIIEYTNNFLQSRNNVMLRIKSIPYIINQVGMKFFLKNFKEINIWK